MATTINLATIVSAATLAFLLSALTLLLTKIWAVIASHIKFRQRFRGRILFEAAEELRRQVRLTDALGYRQTTAILVFVVCFPTILVLGRRDWWPELPGWGWNALGLALVGAMGYYLHRFILTIRRRLHLAYQRDANIALSHGLLHSTSRGNRVFHSVPLDGHVIDNVVIGTNGVYAVSVIPPPKPAAKTVRLKNDQLRFTPGGDSVSLVEHRDKIQLLARELRSVVGHPVKVLSVIGVPGCRIVPTKSDQDLVVNEKSCVMLVGWRVSDANLMDEEVEKITEFFLGSCNRRKKRRLGKDRRTGPKVRL